MRNGKKKKVIISAACIIVVGLLIAGVYMYRLRNREYPVIKNIKLNGENYVREIYPEVEIRYPKVVVDEDSKEYVGTYKLENRCANANDNEKINRRKVKSYYCIDGLYEADNIQSLKMRVANAAGVITTSISIKIDKAKREMYTSKWVDIDMEAMRRTEENNAVEVENVNKCVIEAKITYTYGKEETQYLIMETESKYIVTAVNVYKVNIK